MTFLQSAQIDLLNNNSQKETASLIKGETKLSNLESSMIDTDGPKRISLYNRNSVDSEKKWDQDTKKMISRSRYALVIGKDLSQRSKMENYVQSRLDGPTSLVDPFSRNTSG